MALLSACVWCGQLTMHSASELPQCDRCSGREEERAAEAARWAGLSLEQKVEELKTVVDGLRSASRWDGRIG